MTSFANQKVISLGLVLFFVAWSLFAYLSIRDNVIGLLSDSYVYLLLSDYFSPFRTLESTFANYLLANYAYPPGFPVLLGLLGGGTTNLQANYLIDAGFLAATSCAFYLWVVRQHEDNFVASLLCVVFLLLPVTLISALGIFSEHPYMLAILIAAIILSKEQLSPADYLWAAVLIGIATLIRTVGVAAILALAIVLTRQTLVGKTSRRSTALYVLVALAPGMLWSIVKILNGYDQSYVNAVVDSSYAQTLAGIFDQLTTNSRALRHHFMSLFDSGGTATTLAHVLFCLFALGAWLKRIKVGAFDAVYVFSYLAIILMWPYPNHMARFIFVVLPFLMFYAYDGARLTLHRLGTKISSANQRRIAITGVCVLISTLAGPKTLAIIGDIVSPSSTDQAMLSRTPNWHTLHKSNRESKITTLEKILDSMAKVQRLTPRQACVSSGEPHYVHYFAKRRSAKPSGKNTSEEIFKRRLADCPFIFMMSVASHPPSEFPMMYPFHRIRSEMTVLDVAFFSDNDKKGTVRSMLAATGEARDYEPPE